MFLSACNFQRNMNAAVRHGLPYSYTHHGKIFVGHVRGLSKKFVQYVYKNFILQILGYINVVPFKILPI
jgi:hypothetical protein